LFKCFLTGIELKEQEAFTLDLSAARKAIRELKSRAVAIEKLIINLGEIDKVQTPSGMQRRRRIVCSQIAEALSASFPGANIFISWQQWVIKSRFNRSNIKQGIINNESV